MLQNMVTHLPGPRFSVEQLGIGKVVVYFMTAISVAIIWSITYHIAWFPLSSLDVGMYAGICYEYFLSLVMEVAYVKPANFVIILSIGYGLCYGFGISKVVVYFVIAFFVAIVSTILHNFGFVLFSSLDLAMCAGICHRYLLSRVMLIDYVQSANVLSLLSIVYGFLYFCKGKTNSKKKRVKSTNLGSHNWSRRRVLWLQMKASRTKYVRLACKNKHGATMLMQTKRVKTTSPSHFVCAANSINPVDRLKIVSCGKQTLQPRLYVAQRNLCQILTMGHSPSSNKPAVSIMSHGKPIPNLREGFRVCNSLQKDEDPKWILAGPEYSSVYSGDGPQSFNFNVVDIPEFDPNNNFTVMPDWMRYDPNLEGSKRYTFIVCRCEVPISDPLKHSNGKRHKVSVRQNAHIQIKPIETLTTELLTSFKRELLLFTKNNISALQGALQGLMSHEGIVVSVSFIVQDGEILCISLATSTVCINIDRTILKEADI